jgi:transcriptional regulator with XRE-family HTH domain
MKRRYQLSRKVAEDIKERRKACGLRQLDVALRLGVAPSTISHWEGLYSPISPARQAQITRVLAETEQRRSEDR